MGLRKEGIKQQLHLYNIFNGAETGETKKESQFPNSCVLVIIRQSARSLCESKGDHGSASLEYQLCNLAKGQR